MSRAPVSPSAGDSDKPANASSFIPPPIQRLSRSFIGFQASPSKPQSPADRASNLPSQPSPAPLPGPNRAPTVVDSPSPSKPSNIFPRLHRLEIADDMASSSKKPPLLDLNLSSTSFLEAVATDSDSAKPLYAVETVGSSTTVWRSDPWDGPAKIADIRWPKDIPLKGKSRDHIPATIQMDDHRWRETTTLLKYSGLGSSRKFQVPYHAHALKWKREGNLYVCTTSTRKGPVAILESFNSVETPPRLKVFENLGSFHQSVPRFDYAGVSLPLLDHLFVTALLLVTEHDDWMTLVRNPCSLDGRPSDVPLSFRIASTSRASARQWRKIMYGEPMYPSLRTPACDRGCENGGDDADVLDISDIPEPPQLTSVRQWRKIVYGEPLYPSLRPQSVDPCDLPPRPSTATSFSSESAYSPEPPTPSSAPSIGYYDASSLFDDPAPRGGIGARRVSSPLASSSGTLSPMPSSECIPLSTFPISVPSGTRRELPSPPSSYQPPPAVQPWLHRSRSSPKLSHSTQSPIPLAGDPDDPAKQGLHTRMPNVRQLPTPPHLIESPIQSPQPPLEARRHSQTPQRSLPPTPASMLMSQSVMEQYHGHSLSQVVTSQPQSIPPSAQPTLQQPGPSMATQNDGAARGRRARPEKDPDEVISWMRNTTRAHRRRAVDGDDDEPASDSYAPASDPYAPAYEAPPAYNAIDFSTPPQARSPPQGTPIYTNPVYR